MEMHLKHPQCQKTNVVFKWAQFPSNSNIRKGAQLQNIQTPNGNW